MNFQGVEICCPQCRSELEHAREEELACVRCNRRYPIVLGIPDLRIFPDPYIGFEDERAKVRCLAERFAQLDFEGFVDFYYSITSVVPAHHARQYKRGLLAGEVRARAWLEAWESAAGHPPTDTLLEIGCGTAPLLVAAQRYQRRMGVDIALRWLVVGKKRLAEAGLDLPLLCACAEALPLRDASFDRVVADSVIEHLKDQRAALGEVYRVLRPGSYIFAATPNRFSLGPDPQTGIWAGSWLPSSWTDAIVRRQGGIPPIRHLLRMQELGRLLRQGGFEDIRIFLPAIPADQQAHFSGALKRLIALYDLARRLPGSRHLLYLLGPLFQAVARKPADAS
jgi:SAM-dependent methyltransferase/uncharacterized protein YbaR (Trm112 family)